MKNIHIAAIGPDITLYDPSDNPEEVKHDYGIPTVRQFQVYDGFGIILAEAHKEFSNISLHAHRDSRTEIFDVKGFMDKTSTDGRL